MIDYIRNIEDSGLSIYDNIEPDNCNLFIPTKELEIILSNALVGLSLFGLALRTRSKEVKTKICHALGYPVPSSFRKTKPRFPGQNFDVLTQKSRNVQIWNEEIDENRRYVILQINQSDKVTGVRVITGKELASFDNTGTLTQKYQACMKSYRQSFCSSADTEKVSNWICRDNDNLRLVNPNSYPMSGQLLYIDELFECLLPMVGKSISYIDSVQERNRGAQLHEMVCKYLGYKNYKDDGAYPDIPNQLLEVKLQTSQTIDLGAHSPEGSDKIFNIDGYCFYSCDIRYAIFEGKIQGDRIILQHLYLITGKDFSRYFKLFKGRGTNAKKQSLLPIDFFE